ncbi:MAG: glycosyltransferase, partial [Planctomycetota bacterium]
MRILTVTALFPSVAAPTRGVFIRERMKAVAKLGAEVRVIAPVPHVPPGSLGNRYASFRDTPDEEVIDGLRVVHPRYWMLPKVGMYIQERSYARGIRAAVADAVREFQPDLIDAHYLYPDGCAVARVAAEHGIPFAVSARGSDVKLLGTIAFTKKRIHAMLEQAALVISVSADLRDNIRSIIEWPGDVAVIPNGIDPEKFHIRPREEACEQLKIPSDQRRVVCVGHLVEEHRQELLVRGLADEAAPSDLHVYLVGDGPEHGRITELART